MGAINDDLEVIECAAARKGALGEFDIASLGIIKAPGTAQRAGFGQGITNSGCHHGLDFILNPLEFHRINR